MTTEELIQKCIKKDYTAWNEFVRRYRALVIRGVRYKLKKLNVNLPSNEFHDIVQEIFLHIWEKEKLSSVKDAACVRGWLAMISVNMTFNYCKNKRFRLERDAWSLDKDICSDRPGVTLGTILPSLKLDNGKTLESNELGGLIEKEISKLSPKQQLALKLNLYEGKTQKDVARIMNVPESAVAALIKRGKDRLREGLKGYLG
jgi:RNA polymerase sigma factor (sigma-70 family)